MLIGIDASRATAARRTGTERYALELIRALLEAGPGHEFRLYFRDQPAPGLFSRGTHRVLPFPRLWTHVRLSWELLAGRRPDVLFVPAHVLPLAHPLPSVVTVHDLGYRRFPEAHPLWQRLYLDASTRFSARAASRVIADSQATRADLGRLYDIPAEKVRVVYPGRDPAMRRVDPAAVRARHSLPERYLLYVGTLQPRKNLLRLIEAARAAAPAECPLVLAGQPGWLSGPIVEAARRAGARLLGYVPDGDLAGLYSGASAFVFPSLYEGFGFPLLEAMACGTPVVCSDAASLPEVAGQAALRVPAEDARALAEAIRRVLADADLRARLIAEGARQVVRFSWGRAARETMEVLEEAALAGR